MSVSHDEEDQIPVNFFSQIITVRKNNEFNKFIIGYIGAQFFHKLASIINCARNQVGENWKPPFADSHSNSITTATLIHLIDKVHILVII